MDKMTKSKNYLPSVFKLFFLLLITHISFGQKMIEATSTQDMLKGQLNINFKVSSCSKVVKVELLEFSTQKRTILSPLKGEVNNLSPGNHLLIFDLKSFGGINEKEFGCYVFIDSCKTQVNIPERKVVTHTEASKLQFKAHPFGLKLGVGAIGILTAFMAKSIKNNFDDKVKTLNALDVSLPQIGGQLQTIKDLETWNSAYAEAQNAQKSGLMNAMVATSIIALGYEVFLFTTKTKKIEKGLTIQPSINSSGLSLTYTF